MAVSYTHLGGDSQQGKGGTGILVDRQLFQFFAEIVNEVYSQVVHTVQILRDLLRVNTWLLGGAYHQLCCFILNKYGSLKSFECLHCTKNAACFECFENYYVSFKEMIEQELFPLSQECGSDEPFKNMR